MTSLSTRPDPSSVIRDIDRDPDPIARARDALHSHSPSLVMLVIVATLGVLAYAAFLLNPANRGDWLPYSMVIVAEVILIANALLTMWTILSGSKDPRDFAFYDARSTLFDATCPPSRVSAASSVPPRTRGF